MTTCTEMLIRLEMKCLRCFLNPLFLSMKQGSLETIPPPALEAQSLIPDVARTVEQHCVLLPLDAFSVSSFHSRT